MKSLLTVLLVFVSALSASAGLELNVTDFTSNSITFSISNTHTLIGDSSQMDSGFWNYLNIEIVGNSSWIIGDESSYSITSRDLLLNDALSSYSSAVQCHNSYGDYISLQFENPFTVGSTRGTGTSVTLTFNSTVFDVSKAGLSDFQLYWGDTGTSVPFGLSQVDSAVPEPSTFAFSVARRLWVSHLSVVARSNVPFPDFSPAGMFRSGAWRWPGLLIAKGCSGG
jgi:hypothetical protein